MFKCKEKFNFIGKVSGVTKDGEKYISIDVIPTNDIKKYNFISKDETVINLFNSLQLSRFCEITLEIGFKKEFNYERKTSYWLCVLLGVD